MSSPGVKTKFKHGLPEPRLLLPSHFPAHISLSSLTELTRGHLLALGLAIEYYLGGTEDVVQLVKGLPSIHKALGSIPLKG